MQQAPFGFKDLLTSLVVLAVINQVAGMLWYPQWVYRCLTGIGIAALYAACFLAINIFWQRYIRQIFSLVVFSLVRMACFGYLIYTLTSLPLLQPVSRLPYQQTPSGPLLLFAGFFGYLFWLGFAYLVPRLLKPQTDPKLV